MRAASDVAIAVNASTPMRLTARAVPAEGGFPYASLMLPETVREAARRFGERTAYVDEDGRTLTYADIDRISDGVAAGLRDDLGVGGGDVVALVLPPGLDYLLA